METDGLSFLFRPAPPESALWPWEEEPEGLLLPVRPAPPQAALWPLAGEDDEELDEVEEEDGERSPLPVPIRPVSAPITPRLLRPVGAADVAPVRSRTDRAARSSRLRGALAAVLIVLVGVTLLQVRSARAERNEFRRLQLASVAQALAAQVDRELTAGHHERAALLARQADLFDRQTGATRTPEVRRALLAALTGPTFSRLVATTKGGLWSLALSPDGTRLATAGTSVRLVDLGVARGRGVALSGHLGALGSVAFSPDGKTLAAGGDDPTVRLWRLSPGLAPVILEGHTDRLTSLAFGFAGQRLATASRDGTVRLWDLGTTPRQLRFSAGTPAP